ncbi:hypothetical protein GS682_20645 [Nostoc sp. B(2019)]|nr:hypothetical protein [Nostoc sp. B(2019)]
MAFKSLFVRKGNLQSDRATVLIRAIASSYISHSEVDVSEFHLFPA